MQIDDAKNQIIEICRDHWRRTGKACLISTLGQRLSADAKLSITLQTGMKLQQFVLSSMANDLRIERRPGIEDDIGLFPKGTELPLDLSTYFSVTTREGLVVPRYVPSVWAAFAVPIPPGKRRHFDSHALRFYDLDETMPPPPGTFEISPDKVPPSDAGDRTTIVAENLRAWLKDRGLDESKFVAKVPTQVNAPTRAEGTVLYAFINALDEKDLGRMTLPLDIVAKLLRKPL